MKTCSVIVPIYNAAPYLAQCLSSIRMQTYPDLQVILIDDGSTDESAAIAQAFVDSDARFVLYRQSNQGQSAARNAALTQATGEYLVFVDADDYLDADFIAVHLSALGQADYVQSGYRRRLADGTILEQKMPLHRYQFISPCMRLYRMSFIRQYHFSFPASMIYEDVIFSLLLWGRHPHFHTFPYCGYNYTCNPHSTTSVHHTKAQQHLFSTIRHTHAPYWLKLFTMLRLYIHFKKS